MMKQEAHIPEVVDEVASTIASVVENKLSFMEEKSVEEYFSSQRERFSFVGQHAKTRLHITRL